MKAARQQVELVAYHVIEFYYFALNLLLNPRLLAPMTVMLLILMPSMTSTPEFPVFRVVIDPGHGGVGKHPMSVHGDRYDSVTGRYLDFYKEGAARGRMHERAIVYSIAKKTEKLLKLLGPGGNQKRFFRLLENYSDDTPRQITVVPSLSRGRSITENEAEGKKDPNAPYRMFDYPGNDGDMQPGRISGINETRPHLVVSLHLANAGPADFEGMSPVITPSHDFLRKGLGYLKGERSDRKFYLRSPYREWFIEGDSRDDFEWFLNDVSLYFLGYPLTESLELDRGGFKGYRYNMVRWAYADDPGWERAARHHVASSRFADSFDAFVPEGRFWDRESSPYERFRRDGGIEGFGGDNAYASYELIRYIYYSLYLRGENHRSQKPGKSYVSVWIMPLHVNAVNAFIELGYLNRARDRFLLANRQDEIAEGIAVGIYSLLCGLTPKDKSYIHAPRGKEIDFTKYRTSDGRSYFDAVNDR